MKLRKVMASVCCMGLVAGLAGCGGSKEAPATTAAAAAEADQKEESKDDAKEAAPAADEKKFQIDRQLHHASRMGLGPACIARWTSSYKNVA